MSIPTTATDTLPSQTALRLPVFGVYLHAEDIEQGRVWFLSQSWWRGGLVSPYLLPTCGWPFQLCKSTGAKSKLLDMTGPFWQHFHVASQNVQGRNSCPCSVSCERLSKPSHEAYYSSEALVNHQGRFTKDSDSILHRQVPSMGGRMVCSHNLSPENPPRYSQVSAPSHCFSSCVFFPWCLSALFLLSWFQLG